MNHYGIQVDPEVPTTGVFNCNNLEFLYEEATEGVDLAQEEHAAICEKGDECDCDIDSDSFLIGFKKNNQGLYDPDPEAEYSAIFRSDSNVVQVVKSKWGIRCALCSPCYPGQGDGDTPGEFLAFSVPPEVVGNYGDQELKKRIFLIEEEGK